MIITALRRKPAKGVPPVTEERLRLVEKAGIEGDANFGQESRQLTLISRAESEGRAKNGLCAPKFFANIELDRIDASARIQGQRLRIGDALIEIEKIGKQCYSECEVFRAEGPCPLAKGSLFARVIDGGVIRVGGAVEEA